MHNKLLSLLVIFIGLPSFVLTGGQKTEVEQPSPERQLDNLRLANKVTVNYIKYKVEHAISDSIPEEPVAEVRQ